MRYFQKNLLNGKYDTIYLLLFSIKSNLYQFLPKGIHIIFL